MRERKRTLNLRLDDTELAMLHVLADAEDTGIAALLRKWVRDRWRAERGSALPPPVKSRGGMLKPTSR